MLLIRSAAEAEVGLAIVLRALECLRVQRLLVLAVKRALLRRLLLLQVHVVVIALCLGRAHLATMLAHLERSVSFCESLSAAVH